MRDFSQAALAGDQIRFRGGQRRGILKDGGLRGESDLQLLLLGIKSLACQVNGGLCGLYSCPVLIDVELGVTHFDAHLILELVQTHLSLAVFQLRAHLVGLRCAIA